MRNVTIAATQMACTDVVSENVERGEKLVRDAVSKGANVVLLQELFEGYYFCQDELPEFYARALPAKGHPTIEHFKGLARELGVVLPVSFYEEAGNARFNSIAIIDADGTDLGIYRKSHIPHGSGYQEKYYFSPGDTGFKVWETLFGRIGVGICWDQWFPETARSMAVMGAEMLFFPTAIGSELLDPSWDFSSALATGTARTRRRQSDAAGGIQPDRHRARSQWHRNDVLRLVVHCRFYRRESR